MAEQTLFDSLETYNKDVPNNYRDNWGSLLTYISKYRAYLICVFLDTDDATNLITKSDFM